MFQTEAYEKNEAWVPVMSNNILQKFYKFQEIKQTRLHDPELLQYAYIYTAYSTNNNDFLNICKVYWRMFLLIIIK